MKRTAERGSILLLAVLLGGLLAALTVSLLATAAIEMRGTARAEAARTARSLARSGIEIGAARRLAGPWKAGVESLELDGGGGGIAIDLDPARTPAIRVEARSQGVARGAEADVAIESALGAHALAVFGPSNAFHAPVWVRGSAYFATLGAPFARDPLLDLTGDLELASAGTVLGAVRFAHEGAMKSSCRSAELPQVDAAALLAELGRRGVPIVRAFGSEHWIDTSIRGVLWAELGFGEELLLENLEIDGALVVHASDLDATAAAGTTAHARVAFRGSIRIRAAPEVLGDLAFSAPCMEWHLGAEGTTRIEGLALVGAARDLHDLEITGALWARGTVHALHRVRLALPDPWIPVLPDAVIPPPSLSRVRIDWR